LNALATFPQATGFLRQCGPWLPTGAALVFFKLGTKFQYFWRPPRLRLLAALAACAC